MKILIVDDDEAIRYLFKRVISSLGHEVTDCEDAEAALSAYLQDTYPLVILDWMLPCMDGLQLCRQIRMLPQGNNSIIVMATARSNPEDLQAVLDAGADDYIAKPIDIGLLKTRLTVAERMALNLRERRRAEESLKCNEERFRSVVENANDAIITTNNRGEIISWNFSAEHIFGYSADETLGKPITLIIPGYFRKHHQEGLNQVVSTGETNIIGKTVEFSGLRKDGREFPAELSIATWNAGQEIFFTGIIRDISERKKAEQMKNEFISTVSHELKTPLTSIRGSLGLITGGMAGEIPEQAKKLIDIAYKNCERLIPLINDIMDIEKIETGKMEYKIMPLQLMPLVEQACEANQSYAEQFGVKLKLEHTLPDVMVNADSDRLMQVITNLLSNAAKFSPPDDTVTISVLRIGISIRVAITDHGPGIPKEFRSRIFQKFARADSKDTRQKGGTGLGLSISKAIIDRLGGYIGYLETDEGTTFYFDLPELRKEDLPAEPSTDTPTVSSGETKQPDRRPE